MVGAVGIPMAIKLEAQTGLLDIVISIIDDVGAEVASGSMGELVTQLYQYEFTPAANGNYTAIISSSSISQTAYSDINVGSAEGINDVAVKLQAQAGLTDALVTIIDTTGSVVAASSMTEIAPGLYRYTFTPPLAGNYTAIISSNSIDMITRSGIDVKTNSSLGTGEILDAINILRGDVVGIDVSGLATSAEVESISTSIISIQPDRIDRTRNRR